MKELSHFIHEPIYRVAVELVLAENVNTAFIRRAEIFKDFNEPGEVAGLVCYADSGNFVIFFDRKELCHNVIAHEVYHCAAHILGRAGVKYKLNNHESYAYMVGWLTEQVYTRLKKWKVSV